MNAVSKIKPETPVKPEEAKNLLDKFQERFGYLFTAPSGVYTTRFKKGFFHV